LSPAHCILVAATSTLQFAQSHVFWPLLTARLQARKTQHPAKPRQSLQPGTVVILLAGRFRGKRVVVLKHLPQGVLLVTGPFKVNGVPLRRVNARYVIATSTSVDINGVDEQVLKKASEDGYFTKDKAAHKPGEDAFFKQGEKPEVRRGGDREGNDALTIATEEGDVQGPCRRPEGH